MNDLLITIGAAVLGIVGGGIITYIVGKAQKDKKSLHFWIKDFDLISRNIINDKKEIEILFKKKRIEELRLARFFIWNSGNIAMRGADISAGDTLRLSFPRADMITILEVNQSRAAVDVTCRPSENSVSVEFDTLDQDDFVVGRILYSAVNIPDAQSDTEPMLEGAIAGIPGGMKFLSLEEHLNEKHWTGRLNAFFVTVVSLFTIVPAYSSFQLKELTQEAGVDMGFFGEAFPYVLVFVAFLTISAAIIYNFSRWRVSAVRVPDRLKKLLVK